MDFQSLSRKDLQTLCKKNNIRANMTNAAMVDALQALDVVEGIEDVPSDILQESPKRTSVRSMDLPRTCGRSSNRRKPIEDESKDPEESPMSPPRTRRGTAAKATIARRRICRDEDQEKEEHVNLPEVLAENNRREVPNTPMTRNARKREMAASTSVRRGADSKTHVHEEEKENENQKDAVLRTYSTRRSTRLSEKRLQEAAPSIRKSRGRKEAITIATLSVESDESEKEKPGVQDEEQGVLVKQDGKDLAQDLSVIDEDLAPQEAAHTVIPAENVSAGNQDTVLESPAKTESCKQESQAFIVEGLKQPNKSMILTDEAATEVKECEEHPTESSKTVDNGTTVIADESASIDNQAAVVLESPPIGSSKTVDDAATVIADEAASIDNQAAVVLEYPLPIESCKLESKKCHVDLPADSSVTENQRLEHKESEPDADGGIITDPSSGSENLNLENFDLDADASVGLGVENVVDFKDWILQFEDLNSDADSSTDEKSGDGIIMDPSSGSEYLNLENFDHDADASVGLGAESAMDFFPDEVPVNYPTERDEEMVEDQIPNSQNFKLDTSQGTNLKGGITISTIENLVVVEGEEPSKGPNRSFTENPLVECQGVVPGQDHRHEKPEISTTQESAEAEVADILCAEIDGELPIIDPVLFQTPSRLGSNGAGASKSAQRSGNKSNKSLRLSLSNKKCTPVKNKVLEDANKENKNACPDSGRKEFGSLRKVKNALVEETNTSLRQLKNALVEDTNTSLRQLKKQVKTAYALKEKKLENRAPMKVLNENCSLGKEDQ